MNASRCLSCPEIFLISYQTFAGADNQDEATPTVETQDDATYSLSFDDIEDCSSPIKVQSHNKAQSPIQVLSPIQVPSSQITPQFETDQLNGDTDVDTSSNDFSNEPTQGFWPPPLAPPPPRQRWRPGGGPDL